MKKIFALFLVTALLLASAVAIFASTGDEEPTKTIDELFDSYYNNGEYLRSTVIYANPITAAIAFHGPVVTERLTYFYIDGEMESLWMNTNSGYRGSDVEYPTEHFYMSSDSEVVDYTISQPANKADATVRFYTMKYFSEADTSVWSENDGVWTTTDAATIEAVLGFAASCFTNKDNYVTLTKAVVYENSEGLVFKLYCEASDNVTSEGVIGGEYVIARTVVSTDISGMATEVAAKRADR